MKKIEKIVTFVVLSLFTLPTFAGSTPENTLETQSLTVSAGVDLAGISKLRQNISVIYQNSNLFMEEIEFRVSHLYNNCYGCASYKQFSVLVPVHTYDSSEYTVQFKVGAFVSKRQEIEELTFNEKREIDHEPETSHTKRAGIKAMISLKKLNLTRKMGYFYQFDLLTVDQPLIVKNTKDREANFTPIGFTLGFTF